MRKDSAFSAFAAKAPAAYPASPAAAPLYPMLTKVLIQRIGRTLVSTIISIRRLPRFADFWHPAASGPPLRLPASLYLPAFRPLPAPDELKARDRPKGSSCCRYVFVGHRSVCPVIIILLSSESNTGASSTSKVLKNGIICALPRSNILRFWSSLISTRNPGNNLHLQIRFHMRITGNGVDTGCQLAKLGGDFFFSSAVFSLTSRAFFSVSSGTATVAGFGG